MSALTPELRATLAGLAALLVPAGEGLPAAVEVGVEGTLLDDVLRARSDLEEPLLALLRDVTGEQPAAALARLHAEDRERFDLLGLVVAGGYLMAPEVGVALRYPGQEAKQVDPHDVVSVIEDGLLDAVIERGEIYRPTPQPADIASKNNQGTIGTT
jgi:hypothetical protein